MTRNRWRILLMIACLAAFARRAEARLLAFQFEAGAARSPDLVCIVADSTYSLPKDAGGTCASGKPCLCAQDLTPSGPSDAACAEKTQVNIRLSSLDRTLNVSRMRVQAGRVDIYYNADRDPNEITIHDARGGAGVHPFEDRTWVPAFGAAAVPVSIVPECVRRKVAPPPYTCLAGARRSSAPLELEIDGAWGTVGTVGFVGCGAAAPGVIDGKAGWCDPASETACLVLPAATRVDTLDPVVPRLDGFSFAWRRHPLFEGTKEPTVLLATAARVRPGANPALKCTAGKHTPDHFIWSCSVHPPLPFQIEMRADGKAQDDHWLDVVSEPGEILSSYVAADERRVSLDWATWCTARGARSSYTSDRIGEVHLIDPSGHSHHMTPPPSDCGAAAFLTLPGVYSGAPIVVQYSGDRAFHDKVIYVGGDPKMPSGNRLTIPTPSSEDRADRVTLGASIGAGGTIGYMTPYEGLSELTSRERWFLSPMAQIGLHILWRGDTDSWIWNQLGYEVGVSLQVRRWRLLNTSPANGETLDKDGSTPLVTLLFAPALRWSFAQAWTLAFSPMAGWGAPAERGQVNGTPDQFVVGAGVGFGYSWFKSLSLELVPRVLLTNVRVTTFDAGGIAEYQSRHLTWTVEVPVSVRFDDLTSD